MAREKAGAHRLSRVKKRLITADHQASYAQLSKRPICQRNHTKEIVDVIAAPNASAHQTDSIPIDRTRTKRNASAPLTNTTRMDVSNKLGMPSPSP